MVTVKYIVLLFAIIGIAFAILNWSIGFKQRKWQVISILIPFVVMSYLLGFFFGKRYTLPQQRNTNAAGKTSDEVDWIKETSAQHYLLSQHEQIENEQVKRILAQISTTCNQYDTTSVIQHEARTKFNNLEIWTHRIGGKDKVFMVLPAEMKGKEPL